MRIEKISAESILDSRKDRTIQIIVKTDSGKFITSAPAGKSKGKYEARPYAKNLGEDIKFVNRLNVKVINGLIKNVEDIKQSFKFLGYVEKLVDKNIGANSLFALEASLLKAIAKENKRELWKFLLENNEIIFPRAVGNAIGGGLHSKGRNGKKPDFQEFLFIGNGKNFKENVKINKYAYKTAGRLLRFWIKKRNDEGAFETDLSNEKVLGIMKRAKNILKNKYSLDVDIGIDIASSSFYKDTHYIYKNPFHKLKSKDQINYILGLIKKNNLFYIEDSLEENDFAGFRELNLFDNKNKCLIVGDDLTATNPQRLKKAVKMKSINAIIIKPNQIGSLVKLKEVIELAKKNNIQTIISHRSGETMDDTIADLCIGFQCNFIKTGIYGKEREAKLNRLIKIEKITENQ